MGVASWGVASWGVASWVGGSGDFTDPNEWSNGTSPAPPPGAGDLAVYGTAGTVLFSGNTNVEADIQSAMTFDVSGGDYDLINTTEGLGGLQFKQGGALTITGPGEVDASVISAGPDLVAVTNMAVLSILADASNSAAMFGNSATLAISGGGMFETQGSIALNMQALYPNSASVLTVNQGTVAVYALQASQATLAMQGGIMALSAIAGPRVLPSSFTTGSYDLEAGSTLAAGSAGLTLSQSTGTVAGSTLAVAGDLEVQDGRLTVGASGTVTGKQVGLSAGLTPSLVVGVTAGLLSASGNLDISAGSAASTVTVGIGANGILSGGSILIGGNGTMTVTVTGGTLATTGSLIIAETGTAALVIGAGGTEMVGGPLIVGHQTASQGTDSVRGAGAAMIVQGAGTIGATGSGTLVLAAGAYGTFATGVTLGDAGDGHLFVSASTLSVAGDEIFGDGGQGTLSILAQGLDTATGNVTFGAAGGSAFGHVTVGTLSFGNTLAVGSNGTGTLVVEAAGSVVGNGRATEVAIGAQGGSGGTLSILAVSPLGGMTGGGTLTAGSLGVGGGVAVAGGSGTLIVAPGAKALFAGEAQVWGSGVIDIYGGTISADDLRIAAGGMLYGNGTVIGPAEIDGMVVVNGDTDLQAKAGPLIFLNDVSGTGTLETGFQQTLVLNAAVAADNTILFYGLGGVLDLGEPSAMLGTLTGFAAGDQIDLADTEATQAMLIGSVIEITNNGALVADIATSNLTGVPGFDVASDNNGGTLITIGDAATGPAGTPSYPGAPLVTTVPAGITAVAGAATPITGISITDPSAGTGVTVTALITAQTGQLTANAAGGGQITSFNSGMALEISGDLAEVNADLATLSYQGSTSGTDTLTVDSGDSVGDSDGHVIAIMVEPPCFCAGTRIMTTRGPIAVETLAIGDRVVTAAGYDRPVVLLGHRRIAAGRHRHPDRILPVRVATDAFGPGIPVRRLFLSPDHAVFVDGVLIPIKHLINGRGIARIPVEFVEYWHVELDRHDILLAENLPCESYLDTGNRATFANGAAHIDLHPDFAARSWTDACAELVQDGPRLIRVKQRLFDRDGGSPERSTLTLLVLADENPLIGQTTADGNWCFTVPAGITSLHLVSPTWMPAARVATSLDRRRLGIRLLGLAVDGDPIDLDSRFLSSGFHPLETTAEGPCRWTDGDARLALPLGASTVALCLADKVDVSASASAAAWRRENQRWPNSLACHPPREDPACSIGTNLPAKRRRAARLLSGLPLKQAP